MLIDFLLFFAALCFAWHWQWVCKVGGRRTKRNWQYNTAIISLLGLSSFRYYFLIRTTHLFIFSSVLVHHYSSSLDAICYLNDNDDDLHPAFFHRPRISFSSRVQFPLINVINAFSNLLWYAVCNIWKQSIFFIFSCNPKRTLLRTKRKKRVMNKKTTTTKSQIPQAHSLFVRGMPANLVPLHVPELTFLISIFSTMPLFIISRRHQEWNKK